MTPQRHTSQFTGDDRAAVITPPGEGGIGVIQLAGAGSPAVVQAIFRSRRPADPASSPERLHYGHIVHEGEELDEVLVALADTSPAGCAFEINCHGGIVAVERIMAALETLGVSRIQQPPADEHLDAIQQEAAQALPRALSRQAVRLLLEQHGGALSRELESAIRLDESDAGRLLERLLETASLGIALCEPRRVVIAGSPNAGKSTLFNALVGHARAIVTEVPGTTRDYISEFIVLAGVPLEIVDTAGLRETDHIVEREGVRISREQIALADLVLLLIDAAAPHDADLAAVRRLARREGAGMLIVANKIDLPGAARAHLDFADSSVSAATSEGIGELEKRMVQAVAGNSSYTGGPAVFTPRQRDRISAALDACTSGDAAFRGILSGVMHRQ